MDWIADCLTAMRTSGKSRIEPSADAEAAWVKHVNDVADSTLYPLANSWYVGANIPGKPRVFMPYVGGFAGYKKTCDAIAAEGYSGFEMA
jgi:cyclohexanone monooxygenase